MDTHQALIEQKNALVKKWEVTRRMASKLPLTPMQQTDFNTRWEKACSESGWELLLAHMRYELNYMQKSLLPILDQEIGDLLQKAYRFGFLPDGYAILEDRYLAEQKPHRRFWVRKDTFYLLRAAQYCSLQLGSYEKAIRIPARPSFELTTTITEWYEFVGQVRTEIRLDPFKAAMMLNKQARTKFGQLQSALELERERGFDMLRAQRSPTPVQQRTDQFVTDQLAMDKFEFMLLMGHRPITKYPSTLSTKLRTNTDGFPPRRRAGHSAHHRGSV